MSFPNLPPCYQAVAFSLQLHLLRCCQPLSKCIRIAETLWTWFYVRDWVDETVSSKTKRNSPFHHHQKSQCLENHQLRLGANLSSSLQRAGANIRLVHSQPYNHDMLLPAGFSIGVLGLPAGTPASCQQEAGTGQIAYK